MEFIQELHTKEYLLNFEPTLIALAENSAAFAQSPLSQDKEILSFKIAQGRTIAHCLAKSNSAWAISNAANNIEILQLRDTQNQTVAHFLAKYQPAWLSLDASNDLSVLQLRESGGETVAHWLAQYRAEWVGTEQSKNKELLKLSDNVSITVAHRLARHQSAWVYSDEINDFEILSLQKNNGISVAHELAFYQSDWIGTPSSENIDVLMLRNDDQKTVAYFLSHCHLGLWGYSNAARNKSVLKMTDKHGISIAQKLLNHHSCLENDSIFHKDILTIDCEGKMLADLIVENFKRSHNMTLQDVIVVLISQGAAYKSPEKIHYSYICSEIIERTQALIDDCPIPLVSLKMAMALYSTFFHNLTVVRQQQITSENTKWAKYVTKSEKIIEKLFKANPGLMDESVQVDCFCEPAADFISRYKSERNLNMIDFSGIANEASQPESTAKNDANMQPIY